MYYEYDIRSMINYIQSSEKDINIISKNTFKNLINKNDTLIGLTNKINKMSIDNNIDKYSIIKDYTKYIIFESKETITRELILSYEFIIRNIDTSNDNNFTFILSKLLDCTKLIN